MTVRTRADSRFRRIKDDLWCDLHVQATDAALGITVRVPGPGRTARLRVPPGTQPGAILRVTGRGLPRYDGHGRGALNVTVIVDIPRQLTSGQRQLYEQLRAEDAPRIKSQARGSRQPGTPRSGGRLTAGAGGRRADGRGFGLVIFPAVLLAVIGLFNLLDGIAAIAHSHIFIAGAHYVVGDLRAWGWVATISGAVQLLAAAGVWAGNRLARWFAMTVVGLNTITQMLLVPAYPFWSLVIIAVDIVALSALGAYGSRKQLDGDEADLRGPDVSALPNQGATRLRPARGTPRAVRRRYRVGPCAQV